MHLVLLLKSQGFGNPRETLEINHYVVAFDFQVVPWLAFFGGSLEEVACFKVVDGAVAGTNHCLPFKLALRKLAASVHADVADGVEVAVYVGEKDFLVIDDGAHHAVGFQIACGC